MVELDSVANVSQASAASTISFDVVWLVVRSGCTWWMKGVGQTYKWWICTTIRNKSISWAYAFWRAISDLPPPDVYRKCVKVPPWLFMRALQGTDFWERALFPHAWLGLCTEIFYEMSFRVFARRACADWDLFMDHAWECCTIFSSCILGILREVFRERWIGKSGTTAWPAGASDISP